MHPAEKLLRGLVEPAAEFQTFELRLQRRDLRADVVALFGKDVAAGAERLSAGPDERQERANLLERKTAEFQVLDD